MTGNQAFSGGASDPSGSAPGQGPSGGGESGQGKVDVQQLVQENENLKKVLGEQGNELGEYREFLKNIEPLAKKLEDNPAVFDLIMEGKINDEVAKMVAEGKISAKEAKDVAQAHTEVAKEAGAKLSKMTPDEVERLVEEKVRESRDEMERTVGTRVDEFRKEQGLITDAAEFIEGTADFAEYAEAIDDYLGKHPDLVDVAEAYYAVKGRELTRQAAEGAEAEAAEAAKRVAVGSVPGGGLMQRGPVRNDALVDSLFGAENSPTSYL